MNLEINDDNTYPIDECQRRAAYQAVDDCINKKVRVISVGSGPASLYATKRIIERFQTEDDLCNLIFIPNSNRTRDVLMDYDIPVSELNLHPDIDVAFGSVTEIDSELNAIKGGDGYLLQEKPVAAFSKQYVAVGDYTQLSDRLGQQYCGGVPIEVCKATYKPTQHRLQALLGGEVTLCMAQAKNGPLVSDSNLYMLKWEMKPHTKYDFSRAHDIINSTSGVAECGIWIDMFSKAYVGMANGRVRVLKKANARKLA